MIKVIEIPQESFFTMNYDVVGDMLNITIDDISEAFDFTNLPEGIMESVEVDFIPINPVISAERVGNEIVVKMIRFYSSDEKELFETGEPASMPFGGGLIG